MRPTDSTKELERRRLRAMALLQQGHAQVEIARMLGVTAGAVSQWKKAYQAKGAKGLATQAAVPSGPVPRLSGKAPRQLERLLLKGARQQG